MERRILSQGCFAAAMSDEIDFRSEGKEAPVKRVVWSTDLHFDAGDRSKYHLFFDLLASYEPDIVLIGGDISNGDISLAYLSNLAQVINKQCYFVLGNHDFYYGSITKTRERARQLSEKFPKLCYLTDRGIFQLSDTTALIGHDGWSDGRAGDFMNSNVMLNDYLYIEELKRLNHEERLVKLNQLGQESADYLKKEVEKAFETYERAIVLTHTPPFEKSCLHKGLPADDNWLPHFVCKAMGEALEKVMLHHPEKHLLILCGHTHWGHDIQILRNLRVVTGQSELGIPSVQGLIFVN